MTQPSLSRNIGWTIAGNAAYSVSQWGVVIAVARFADAAAVGTLAYAMALVAPATALASLQLRPLMATAAAARFDFSEFLKLRVVLLSAAFLALAVYCYCAGLNAGSAWTVAGVAIWRGFDGIADIYFGRWQAQEKMARISQTLVFNGALSLVLVVALLLVSRTPVMAAFATAIGSVITVVVIAVRRPTARSRVRWAEVRIATMRELAMLASPLGVVMALIAIQGNVPRYFIEGSLGVASLGGFAAAAQLPLAGSTVVAAIASAASARLVRLHTNRQWELFWNLVLRLVACGLALGAAGAVLSWFAGRAILAAVYGASYSQYRDLLVLLSLVAAMTFVGSFLGHAMTMAGESRAQAPLFAIVVVVAIASSAYFVPRHGLSGAAISMVGPALVQIAGSVLVLRRATLPRRGAAVDMEED